MVIASEFRQFSKGLACKSILSLLAFCFCMLLSACQSQTAVVSLPVSTKSIELPKDVFVKGQLSDTEFLSRDPGGKVLRKLDISQNTLTDYLSVQNSAMFFGEIVANSDWVIWTENNSLIYDTSNKPFNWTMYVYQISSKKTTKIDTSNFITNRFQAPAFINFTPNSLSLSKNGYLSYCKTTQNGSNLSNLLVLYDLNTHNSYDVKRTDNVTKTFISDCSLDGHNLVWSEYQNYSSEISSRHTQYEYSNIMSMDISTKTIKQLTQNDFYHDVNISGNNIVAVQIPSNQSKSATSSNVCLISVDSGKIKPIVTSQSPVSKSSEIYRSDPTINNNYVSWYNNGFDDVYIYDLSKSRFVEIYQKSSQTPDELATVLSMFGRHLFLASNRPDLPAKTYCISLDMP